MTYYIYKCTNKVDNKIYIGCTRNFTSRVRQHLKASLKENKVFHEAIRKHGVCSFTWEILELAEYADDAFELEKKYIEEYGSMYPDGYNLTSGGAGAPDYGGRRVVKLALDGEYVKTYGCANATDRDGYNVTDVLKCCKRKRRSVKGRVFMFEDDYLENGARIYKKPVPKNKKKVIQCDLNGNKISEFDSVAEACEFTGTSRTSILGCLSGTYKTANGFVWVTEDNFPIKNISEHAHKKKGVAVQQLDPITEKVVATYSSFADAGKALGVSHRNIQKVAGNLKRTAYGYKWKRL